MNFKTHLKLRAANERLPENTFFAYEGREIYDFKTKPKAGLELTDASFVSLQDVRDEAISFHFD